MIQIDIDMPTCCAECPCLRHDSINSIHKYQCNITLDIRRNLDRKPNNCPLVDMDDDLIRRQDALDCFHSWIDKHGDVHEPDEMVEYRAIENLPSVTVTKNE